MNLQEGETVKVKIDEGIAKLGRVVRREHGNNFRIELVDKINTTLVVATSNIIPID